MGKGINLFGNNLYFCIPVMASFTEKFLRLNILNYDNNSH